MSPVDVATSAFLQAIVLSGVLFFGYVIFQKWRYNLTVAECARRAGLQVGERSYLLDRLALPLLGNAILVLSTP